MTRKEAAEKHFPFQTPDKEIQCISINDIAKEAHVAFLAGCEYADAERWISVEDRLPDIARVIVSYRFGVGEAMFFEGRFIKNFHVEFPDVTHWQPLPSPPKQKEQ